MRKALITGVSGTTLTADEARFLERERPAGLILFARNCASHEQIQSLVDGVRECVGSGELLVLIDQEGGRVQRLRPPLGRALPPGAAYGRYCDLSDGEQAGRAAFHAARLMADDLKALGINTNCAPVLDVPVAGAHDVIGDRAYGREPQRVADLGRAVAEGYMAGGVLPVVKHIPGHGRATKDSHHDLPVVTEPRAVLEATDFEPFRRLRDMPAAMSAHVVFTAVDPGRPASTSPFVHREVIRGSIGFDGLLMSDDLSMKALSGSLAERAEEVIRAGSDIVLHCNGVLAEMVAAAGATPVLERAAEARFQRCLSIIAQSEPYDRSAAEADLASVLEAHARNAESV